MCSSRSGLELEPSEDVIRRRPLVVAAYLLLVGVVTLAPVPSGSSSQLLGLGLDKVGHVALIAGLALLLLWGPEPPPASSAIAVAALAVIVAGAIELAQIPLPYRACELYDFIAGAGGGIVATVVYQVAVRKRTGADR